MDKGDKGGASKSSASSYGSQKAKTRRSFRGSQVSGMSTATDVEHNMETSFEAATEQS